MAECIDLTDRKFGRLKVISRAKNDKYGKAKWFCVCDCGEKRIVIGSKLISGHTQSCSCLARDRCIKALTKHGLSYTKEYTIWKDMKKRCYEPKATGYHNYGGRGIKVCKRWLDSVEDFISDMESMPTNKHTIDRIDNNGDYKPSNCRWVTKLEQAHNKRYRPSDTTGVVGVIRIKSGKYVAKIFREYKAYHLGTFSDLSMAIRARKNAEDNYSNYGKVLIKP